MSKIKIGAAEQSDIEDQNQVQKRGLASKGIEYTPKHRNQLNCLQCQFISLSLSS